MSGGELTAQERVMGYAQCGDLRNIKLFVGTGALDDLPEAEARKIVSYAYTILADSLVASEVFTAFPDKDALENAQQRAQKYNSTAMDILLNPDGKSLKEQLAEPKIKFT